MEFDRGHSVALMRSAGCIVQLPDMQGTQMVYWLDARAKGVRSPLYVMKVLVI